MNHHSDNRSTSRNVKIALDDLNDIASAITGNVGVKQELALRILQVEALQTISESLQRIAKKMESQ